MRPASGCKDPGVRSLLLLPYVLSRCTDDESITFEAHLLGCAACFRDLKCLDRAGTLLQELLGSQSPSLDRLRETLAGAPAADVATPRARTAKGAAGGHAAKPRAPKHRNRASETTQEELR